MHSIVLLAARSMKDRRPPRVKGEQRYESWPAQPGRRRPLDDRITPPKGSSPVAQVKPCEIALYNEG